MRSLRIVPLIAAALVAAGAARSTTVAAPQGTLVFASNRTGSFEIYTMRADGTQLGQLTRNAVQDTRPAFSPDGKRIAFIRKSVLWVMNADGSGQRPLGGGYVLEFAWSPDSRRLAYTDLQSPDPLMVVGLDGARRRVLAGDNAHPSWSPDGKRIAVGHARNGDARHGLVVVGADGRGLRTIAAVGDTPAWSPRGDLIAFQGKDGLRVVRPDGSGARRVARQAVRFAAWSPDGRRLALETEHALLVAPAAGGAVRSVTPKRFKGQFDDDPAWSPDGRWIAVRSVPDGYLFWQQGDILLAAADRSSSSRPAIGVAYPYSANNHSPGWRPRLATAARLGAPATALSLSDVAAPTVLSTAGSVVALAADGGRVAVGVEGSAADCGGHVTVWKPGLRPVHIGYQQSPDEIGDCDGPERLTGELGLAGTRVAWGTEADSNYSNAYLYTASSDRPERIGEVALDDGSFEAGIGDIHGAGDLLVLDTWSACPDPDDDYSCGPGDGDSLHDPTLTDTELWKVSGPAGVSVRSGRGAFEVMDVDADRIAVLEPGGAVDVLRADGTLLHRLVLPARAALSVQLSGTQLVVLTKSVLQVYDAATGAARGSVPLAASTRRSFAGLDQGLALYVEGRTAHVVRLADGHQTAITPAGKGYVVAQLDPSGLFTGYTLASGHRPGRVSLLGHAELVARLG